MVQTWKKIGAIWVISLLLTPFIATAAETGGDSGATLEEVVVTASKVPKTAGNVTQEVNIIDREKIDAIVSGNHNAAELLTYEPGIFVSVLSRNDANWGSSGGLSQKYNTYMLDGLPIDAFVEPQSLDPMAFERIENQRGPAAVLYPNYLSMDFSGNQSPLTGTTNIILKERIDGMESRVEGYYGSYNTYGGRFFHQQAAGNVHFFFGGSHEASDYTDYGTSDSWLNMIDDPEYEKDKLYLKTTVFMGDNEDHKLSLFAQQTHHEGDAGRPNRDFDHVYQTVNTSYALPINETMAANMKLGYRDYDRTWEEDHYPADLALASENGVKQRIVPADLAFSFKHGQDSLLTIGGDYQAASYKTYSETSRKVTGNDADATQSGLYVQEEFSLKPILFRLGGRYARTEHEIDLLSGAEPGNDNQSWNKFLWSAGTRYTINDAFSLFGNVGTSFVAPSLKSVGGTIALADRGVAGKDGQLPNPDLDPESGIGYDLGANWEPVRKLKFGTRFFYTLIDDQIVTVVVSENPSQSQDINAGDTASYGVEFDVRNDFSKQAGWFANYTYTHTEIDNDNDPDQDGAEVPFVPEHMGNIGVDLKLPFEITASVYLHVAGEIYDNTSKQGRNKFSAYELLNANIRKSILHTDAVMLETYLELYNITNNEFEMPWQFQDPGMSATLGLRLVM